MMAPLNLSALPVSQYAQNRALELAHLNALQLWLIKVISYICACPDMTIQKYLQWKSLLWFPLYILQLVY